MGIDVVLIGTNSVLLFPKQFLISKMLCSASLPSSLSGGLSGKISAGTGQKQAGSWEGYNSGGHVWWLRHLIFRPVG